MRLTLTLLILGMATLLVTSQKLPVQKYRKVLVDPDAWVSNSTTPSQGKVEVCADQCHASYTCKAFSHLESESTCELGDLPNLPDDEDPDGEALYVYVPPADCRTNLAVTQGYQRSNDKYYLAPTSKESNSDNARAVCQAAGADLVLFKTPEDYQAVMGIINGSNDNFWIGIETTPSVDDTCDTRIDPASCLGIFQWFDGSTVFWTEDDHNDWAPIIVRTSPSETCGILINGGIEIHDAPCAPVNARPFCQIDCRLY